MPPIAGEDGPDTLQCPCTQLVAAESIYEALAADDAQQHQQVLDWITGACCARNSDCRVQRVNTSFCILNAIRAACRPYLVEVGRFNSDRISPQKLENEGGSSRAATANNKAPPPKPAYDQQFPSLGGSKKEDKANPHNQQKHKSITQQNQLNDGNSTTKTNTQKAGKKKKRIRPVAVVAPLQGCSGVWGDISKQPPQGQVQSSATQQQQLAFADASQSINSGVWGSQAQAFSVDPKQATTGVWGNKLNATTIIEDNPTKFMSEQQQSIDHKGQSGTKGSSLPSNQKATWGSSSQAGGNSGLQVHPKAEVASVAPTSSITKKIDSGTSFSTPTGKTSGLGDKVTGLLEDRFATTDSTPDHPTNTPRRVSFTPESIESTTTQSTSIIPESTREATTQGTPTKVTPASNAALHRLVEVYCALVSHSLVPSAALEVHLLLRLLNISEPAGTSNRVELATNSNLALPDTPEMLAPIFTRSDRCRSFAVQSLSKLRSLLMTFGVSFLRDLVKSETFRLCLPELTIELEAFIQRQVSSNSALLLSTEQASIFSGGTQTALLTLPFKQDRDSRHNFRTRDELVLYKNREESRDAFLYQLRSFLNVRGKVLDTIQAQRSMMKIRSSCRLVVEGVLNANLPWFSEFFCELLLQVGLVPLEETDKELLNIAGKEKLQKLHKRFSSQVGAAQSNKSSWKLAGKTKKRFHSSVSPAESAQELFPGHQEFFYLFVVSADSFKFNSHLRNQCVQLIKTRQASADYRNSAVLEQSLLQMQMLGRFLGVLVFSPTWLEFDSIMSIYNTASGAVPLDGLQQLESDEVAGIDFCGLIRKSQEEGTLTKSIPWITEFLKIAAWDSSIHTRSKAYRMLIAMLNDVHERLGDDLCKFRILKKTNPCFQLVIWCLESFFGEHIGLAKAASLPLICEYQARGVHIGTSGGARDDTTLDYSPLVTFGSTIVFAASPHLEEVFSLATALSRTDKIKISTRSPGISRKLRPSIVSREVVSRDSTHAKAAPNESALMPLKTTKNDFVKEMIRSGGSSLEAKMTDTFFHQHQEVKEICEFAVHRVLKSLVKLIPERVAKSAGEARTIIDTDNNIEQERAGALIDDALEFLRTSLLEGVHKSLVLLEPPDTHPKVRELAVTLAVLRGYETGAPFVQSLVTQDLNSIQRSLFGANQGDLSSQPEENLTAAQRREALLCKLTYEINELAASVDGTSVGAQGGPILELLQRLEPLVEAWVSSTDPKIPPEKLLRDYFEAVAKLDKDSLSFVDLCLGGQKIDSVTSKERWMALSSFLRIASKLSRHPRRGLSRVRRYLKDLDSLLGLIRLGLENDASVVLSEVLLDMVGGTLISTKCTEDVLVVAREQEGDTVIVLIREFISGLKRRGVLSDPMPRLAALLL